MFECFLKRRKLIDIRNCEDIQYCEDIRNCEITNHNPPSSLCFLGVLWLCIVAESLYLTLLFTGGALMTLEQCPSFSIMNKLKLSAFAAMCTALSGNKTSSASVYFRLTLIKSITRSLTEVSGSYLSAVCLRP